MTDVLRERGGVVDALASCLNHGTQDLKTLPELVERVLAERMWEERTIPQTGKTKKFRSFKRFVETDPLEGLGADIETLRMLCKGTRARDLLDRALQNPVGGSSKIDLTVDIVHPEKDLAPKGNSKDRALRKLRTDAADLHAEVLAGNLTAHAAMVKAGFRHQTVTVRADDTASAARTLRKHMSPEQLAELARLLLEDKDTDG